MQLYIWLSATPTVTIASQAPTAQMKMTKNERGQFGHQSNHRNVTSLNTLPKKNPTQSQELRSL
jgi:hypothetical protein